MGSARLLALLVLTACTPRGQPHEREIVEYEPLTGLSAIAAGANHTCALASDRVLCWGVNFLDILSVQPRSVFRAALGHWSSGLVSLPSPVIGLEGVGSIVQIGAGYNFSCALAGTGRVYCWGANSHGQLGVRDIVHHDRPTQVEGVRASEIYVTRNQACALALDRSTAWCWGSGDFADGRHHANQATPIEIAELASVDQLASRCWLRDRAVRCWGDNSTGQIGNGEGGCEDSPLSALGDDERNCKRVDHPTAPLGLPAIVQIAADNRRSYALDRDGGVWQWGGGDHRPQRVAELPPIVQIAAGGEHACARTEQGELWCWGNNYSGELGFVDSDHRNAEHQTPHRVAGLPAVRHVVAGSNFTCALAGEGEHTRAWCWGGNYDGELGNGTHGEPQAPSLVRASPKDLR